MTALEREAGSALSIQDLSSIVVELLARAPQPLLPRGHGQLGLFVRYLRRKPGRGLAVTYHVDTRTTSRRMRSGAHERWVSLTLGEALARSPTTMDERPRMAGAELASRSRAVIS